MIPIQINPILFLSNIYNSLLKASKLIKSNSIKEQQVGKQEINTVLKYLQNFIPAYKTQLQKNKTSSNKTNEDLNKLAVLANLFDSAGAYATADILDVAALQIRNDRSKSSLEEKLVLRATELDNHKMYIKADVLDMAAYLVKADKKEEEELPPVKPGNEISLSTRYCPDHIGVQMSRVDENIYQCPIDGKVYDYTAGYINYQGQKVPGGSVAAQTPTTTSYSTPHRSFNTRENVLNSMN